MVRRMRDYCMGGEEADIRGAWAAFPEDNIRRIRNSEPGSRVFIDVFENEEGFQVSEASSATAATGTNFCRR